MASHVALVVKNSPAKTGDIRDLGSIPRSGRSFGGGQSKTHPSILTWRILWMEESGGQWSIRLQRVGHDCDGIPVELFQILKDDAVKVLHSICQQICKTQQWPQDQKTSVFILIPKKGNAKECTNYHTIDSSHTLVK